MNQEEIITRVLTYLDLHLKGTRRSMEHDLYKQDFFKLFAEAYRKGYFEPLAEPMLTGDTFREILVERWFAHDDEDKERIKLLAQLFSKWDEWHYAWDLHG